MCGIVGILGKSDVANLLIDGLKRLEYRGYDSAGIATLDEAGRIERRRAQGKIVNLESRVRENPVQGRIGIGHTRWATHGIPNETNAHPHASDRVVVVHNGIIENFRELRAELTAKGHRFASDTDTEAVVHLITQNLQEGDDPERAVARALTRFEGAFALAILFAGRPDIMIGARRGSPLAIGYGDGEMYLGSDAMALAPLTSRITYLEEGDMVVLRLDSVAITDQAGRAVTRAIRQTALSGALIGKAGHRHFMHKEIYEQPQVIGDALHAAYNPALGSLTLPPLPFDLGKIDQVTIIACGTSYYAGMVAKYWMEKLARVPVEVDIASEFRYRNRVMRPGGLALFISQSGETADTLAALRYCKAQGQHALTVVNVPESTMAREADVVLPTCAGPEIGVASTKGFTTQLTVLACVSVALARARGLVDAEGELRLVSSLAEVPARAAEVLACDSHIEKIAQTIAETRDVIYLGRGTGYPVALEGALKLKEISYIHAEGYAAGELKHGPIALIDVGMPVIVIAPSDDLFEKTASNIAEVAARGARVVLFSDAEGCARLKEIVVASVELPKVDSFVAPILYAIPVQLLAYHVAVAKGTDVDQPRNLAKSVTVE